MMFIIHIIRKTWNGVLQVFWSWMDWRSRYLTITKELKWLWDVWATVQMMLEQTYKIEFAIKQSVFYSNNITQSWNLSHIAIYFLFAKGFVGNECPGGTIWKRIYIQPTIRLQSPAPHVEQHLLLDPQRRASVSILAHTATLSTQVRSTLTLRQDVSTASTRRLLLPTKLRANNLQTNSK